MTQPHYIDRLIGFAVHDDDCTVNRFPGHGACSCGLSVLIQEARHARRDAPMEAVAWREKVRPTMPNGDVLSVDYPSAKDWARSWSICAPNGAVSTQEQDWELVERYGLTAILEAINAA